MASWTLKVLGANALTSTGREGADGQGYCPDRKTAGVLTYLALEGPASRRRLAGLFWPEVDEARARNSLARVLTRLRRTTYPDIVTGREVLRLGGELEVDAAKLKIAAFQGAWETVLASAGELLPHFEYDDSEEFEEWLRHEREALTGLTAQALRARIGALEAAHSYRDALELTSRLIKLDPLQEDAHRLAMRLQHASGDRAAALKTFADLRTLLRADWNAEPSDETVALAAAIERGSTRTPSEPPAPATVKPGSLVGRDVEWAAMESAWQLGHPIMIHGPAGVGKTRLMHEFAASKGSVLQTGGRPGDGVVPLISLARGLRRAYPSLTDLQVPTWVRSELFELVPQLGETDRKAVGGLKFEEALFWYYDAMLSRFDVVVVDDLQFYDAASFEAASRFVNRRPAEGVPARTMVAFRTDEVPASYLKHLEDLSDRGLHTLIELKPLDLSGTCALLAELAEGRAAKDHLARLAVDLHRYTGGNPMFVLETVKHLLERERLGEDFPDRLPPTGKVGAVIRQRFERLSPTAQRVAQAACVLQSEFDLTSIATLLEVGAASLLDAWHELEAAGFVTEGRFSHDLLFEAVDQTLSSPVRQLLQRAAATLRTGVAPHRSAPDVVSRS